ncbi:MAG: BMP family ABC transporter substrate-binding protein [Actinomycetota bacterium]|nr:BMP family ABC transporter substrate-binding protein [Actinomycetota bacterium]
MHRQRAMQVAAVLAVSALAIAGCGGSSKGGSTSSTKKSIKVGLAYDIGGRGDKSFNDAAVAGLDRAKKELNVTTKELTATGGESDAAKETRLRLLAEGGFNPVVAVGFAYAPALKKVAAKYPKTKFAIIDSTDATGDNISNLVFAENEGSFLVGAAAALKSKTHNVGFVGGVQVPLIEKFAAGYKAGVAAVDKNTKVQVKYLTQPPDFSGFGDPAKGKTAAEGMYDAGADIVFAAAGGSGTGVFQAAKAKSKLAIGVDSDQYQSASPDLKPVIMTSMLKRVDNAVFTFIKDFTNGTLKAGPKVFNLKVDGVGYSKSGGKVDDIASKLDDFKKQISDGKITVPEK